MNMLIRFFIMVNLLKQQLKQQTASEHLSVATLTTSVIRQYRVLPHDMGFRDHLPNYRYLSFIELNITHWLMACCHQKGIKNLGWIIAMQEMVYLKEIKFLNKISVNSTLVGWDNKYVYFETRFFVKCSALIRISKTKKHTELCILQNPACLRTFINDSTCLFCSNDAARRKRS